MSKGNGQKQPDAGRPTLGPVPTSVDWQVADGGPAGKFVVFTFWTPLGSATYFFPPAAARQLGAGALRLADSIDDGSVPSAGLIVPEVDVRRVIETLEDDDRKGKRA